MSRRIRWTKRALKGVGRLDRPTQDRILSAIEKLVEEKRGDIKRLRCAAGYTKAEYLTAIECPRRW